jgi:hypothetical protein
MKWWPWSKPVPPPFVDKGAVIREGIIAFGEGKSPQDQPYQFGSSEHNWWVCGWTLAFKGIYK